MEQVSDEQDGDGTRVAARIAGVQWIASSAKKDGSTTCKIPAALNFLGVTC